MPGNEAALRGIVERLEYLANGGVSRELGTLLAETAKREIDRGFNESRDPDGNPWAPLKLRPGGKPLQDTRRNLQGSIVVRFDGERFHFSSPFIGAKVHQYGAVIRPKRAKALRFRGVGYSRAPGARSARRQYTPWLFAQKVTIPARPYFPVGNRLPTTWARAFEETQRRYFSRISTR